MTRRQRRRTWAAKGYFRMKTGATAARNASGGFGFAALEAQLRAIGERVEAERRVDVESGNRIRMTVDAGGYATR